MEIQIFNKISVDINNYDSHWNLFQCLGDDVPDLEITVLPGAYEYAGIEVFPKMEYPLALRSENVLVSANVDWSKVHIVLLDGKTDGLDGALSACIMSHLSTRNGVLFHASLIDYKGKGILFIGPSGIGKTTQAELWNQYRSAVIINGDMALVHYEDSKYYGYGYPIHGSSPYCENRKVELSGIVVLEQDKENHIERLTGLGMVERVLKNIFLPKWYEEGVNAVMDTVDGLLCTVPVYLLKCRKDEQAVELVERVLFKENV